MRKINVILCLIISAVIFYSCGSENLQSVNDENIQNVQLIVENSGLIEKNQEQKNHIIFLERILNNMIASLHCDTLTIQGEINRAKFEEYERKIWSEKEAAISKALVKKRAAITEALVEKNNTNGYEFGIYDEVKFQALKDLEKSHPEDFNHYAILCFWKDNSSIANSHYYWEKMRETSKTNAAIQKYFDARDVANTKYYAAKGSADEFSKEKIKKINSLYETEIKVVKENYEKLLDQKMKELNV